MVDDADEADFFDLVKVNTTPKPQAIMEEEDTGPTVPRKKEIISKQSNFNESESDEKNILRPYPDDENQLYQLNPSQTPKKELLKA